MKKSHTKALRIIRKIAKKEGVPVGYVIDSIEEAIQEAYLYAEMSGDLERLALWNEIPREGKIPNAFEMIEYMGGKFQM